MRNIYDIITEQKMIVDIQLNSYELFYLTNYITENQEFQYIEEGISDIGKKVIEFIKTLLNKIRELISKVINFFRKSGNKEQELNNRISQANGDKPVENVKEPQTTSSTNSNNGDNIKDHVKSTLKNKGVDIKDEKSEPQKKENKPDTKKTPKKVKNIDELLHESKQKVVIHRYSGLQEKMQLAVNFINNVSKCLNECNNKGVTNSQVFVDLVIDKTFRGAGDPMNHPNIPLPERIRLELGEGQDDETGEYHISAIADITLEYLRGKDDAIRLLQETQSKAEKELKNLEKQVINGDEKKINMLKNAANMIGIMANVTSVSVLKAYKDHAAIAEKVTKDYENNK